MSGPSALALAGMVQTVLGPVAPGDLGVTLPHEHLLVDFRKGMVKPERDLDFTLENIGAIRRFPYSVPNNIHLNSVEEISSEMELFRNAGGRTVCELSVVGMRCEPYQPHLLAQLSRETKVNIVHATGFYWDSFLPETVRGMDVREMAELMKGEIGGGVRCGVIYIACSWPLKDSERRALEAAALAQKETGAPLVVHPGRSDASPFEILDLLASNGGDVTHTVITHLDITVTTDTKLLELAGRGCYLNRSFFGKESSHYQYKRSLDMPNDAQRIQSVKLLVDSGFADKVLVSQDIVCRHEFVRYGGHGYAHILEHIVPKMVDRGIDRDTVMDILTRNPQKWLTFV